MATERIQILIQTLSRLPLFTGLEPGQVRRFIAALQALRTPENCALVLTLRADFYPDLMTSLLWPVDASQRVEVAPLRGEALSEAIRKPAADVGVRLEEGLVRLTVAASLTSLMLSVWAAVSSGAPGMAVSSTWTVTS